MLRYFLIFLVSLAFSISFGFPVIRLCKKLKMKQTILHYVDNHTGKNGTPTMGGMIFIFACIFSCSFFLSDNVYNAILVLIVMFAFSFLGFLDDFLKIRFHQNEGLKPYQKIIGQVGISIIISLFVYFKLGTDIDFFGVNLNLGVFIIPFIILFIVAVTNSVNLIDGLDGLSSGVSLFYLLFLGIIISVVYGLNSYSLICFSMVGALFGFLLFNGFPAKIFMGDTGSLGLGGLIAALSIFTKFELMLPIIGIMYVLTACSDILQVAYYKKTHKRIFKMAPLHHHFERCGVHENRIVAIYIVVTIVCGVCTLLGYMAVKGIV